MPPPRNFWDYFPIPRHWTYLKYVLRHKWHVYRECRKLGVPRLIALLHDWDKFLFDEWFPYARCFYTAQGYSQYDGKHLAVAWWKHQRRNKHHWQNWLLVNGMRLTFMRVMVWDSGKVSIIEGRAAVDWPKDQQCQIDALLMPDVYRREMLADWRGAGLALGKPDTKAWYLANRDSMILHPETRAWIENQLGIINPPPKMRMAYDTEYEEQRLDLDAFTWYYEGKGELRQDRAGGDLPPMPLDKYKQVLDEHLKNSESSPLKHSEADIDEKWRKFKEDLDNLKPDEYRKLFQNQWIPMSPEERAEWIKKHPNWPEV